MSIHWPLLYATATRFDAQVALDKREVYVRDKGPYTRREVAAANAYAQLAYGWPVRSLEGAHLNRALEVGCDEAARTRPRWWRLIGWWWR